MDKDTLLRLISLAEDDRTATIRVEGDTLHIVREGSSDAPRTLIGALGRKTRQVEELEAQLAALEGGDLNAEGMAQLNETLRENSRLRAQLAGCGVDAGKMQVEIDRLEGELAEARDKAISAAPTESTAGKTFQQLEGERDHLEEELARAEELTASLEIRALRAEGEAERLTIMVQVQNVGDIRQKTEIAQLEAQLAVAEQLKKRIGYGLTSIETCERLLLDIGDLLDESAEETSREWKVGYISTLLSNHLGEIVGE